MQSNIDQTRARLLRGEGRRMRGPRPTPYQLSMSKMMPYRPSPRPPDPMFAQRAAAEMEAKFGRAGVTSEDELSRFMPAEDQMTEAERVAAEREQQQASYEFERSKITDEQADKVSTIAEMRAKLLI